MLHTTPKDTITHIVIIVTFEAGVAKPHNIIISKDTSLSLKYAYEITVSRTKEAIKLSKNITGAEPFVPSSPLSRT